MSEKRISIVALVVGIVALVLSCAFIVFLYLGFSLFPFQEKVVKHEETIGRIESDIKAMRSDITEFKQAVTTTGLQKQEINALEQKLSELENLSKQIEEDFSHLREKDMLPQGFLGIVMENMPGGGALINNIVDGSAADRAGLEKGDIILSYDGYSIQSVEELVSRIDRTKPGTEVEIKISRTGESKILKVQLGSK